jgi:hypothetical protein
MASQDPDKNAVGGGESAPIMRGNSLLRLYWMAIGNIVLLVVVGYICKQPVWTLTLLDAGYALIALTLFLARYVDIKRFGGETVNGEVATTQHLVRYGAGLVTAVAGLWVLAQAVDI